MEIFGEFFWNFLDDFFAGMFMEEFFGRNFLGGIICLHCQSYLNMKRIDLYVKILSQGRILTNKFDLFARILVCLSEFWFVCQHFGLFASILVNQFADKQTKMPTNNKLDKQKKFRSLEVQAELTHT